MIDEFKVACAYCNDCRCRFHTVAPRDILRDLMENEGWTVGKGWCVLCPNCQEVEEE